MVIFGQPFGNPADGWRVKKSIYSNSSGEKGSTIFFYDAKGELNRGFWSLDNKTRSSKNFYQVDEKGNVIHTFRQFSDSLTSFETFQYNEEGNKIFERFTRSDSATGTASYHYEEGKLISAKFRKYKSWLSADIEYHYKGDRKSGATLSKDDKKIGTLIYTYNENGNLVKEFWDFDGKWSQEFQFRYEKIDELKRFYSSPFLQMLYSRKIIEENYTYNNETGGPSYYQYDKNGLLKHKKFVRSDSLTTNTEYFYDNDNRLEASIRKYSDGKEATFKYQYDKQDNLISREFFKQDSLIGFEYYFYDADGKLTRAVYKKFDNWLSGYIVFDYDDFGLLKSGTFHDENGFDADISFEYNSDFLLDEILWTFSFGKFQKYQFKYE